MRFGDDRTEAAAAKVSAHLRNETESTRTIAAFGNLHKCIMGRCGEHARRRVVVQIGRALIAELDHRQAARVGLRIADGEDVVDLVRADERIDFGHLRLQFVAITLDQTTGYNQALGLAFRLKTRRFENRVDRFLLRRVDKAARVYHDGLGIGGVRRDLITVLLQVAHHHFTIDEVLGTPETNKSDFLHPLLSAVKTASARSTSRCSAGDSRSPPKRTRLYARVITHTSPDFNLSANSSGVCACSRGTPRCSINASSFS